MLTPHVFMFTEKMQSDKYTSIQSSTSTISLPTGSACRERPRTEPLPLPAVGAVTAMRAPDAPRLDSSLSIGAAIGTWQRMTSLSPCIISSSSSSTVPVSRVSTLETRVEFTLRAAATRNSDHVSGTCRIKTRQQTYFTWSLDG